MVRRSRLRAWLASAGALVAACSSSLDIPADAKLDCSSSACPSGWTCTASRRCVPSDAIDVLPPALSGAAAVSPVVARSAVNPTVVFTVSEALSADPVVRADVGVTRTLTRISGSAPGRDYVYGYTRAGDEPQGTDCPITVDLTDMQGVTSTGLAGGALRFDDAAPGALAAAVAGSPARSGGTVRVAFTASEPLAADPVVRAGDAAFIKDPSSSGLDYVYVRVADGTEPEGAGVAVTATLADAAGNQADVSLGAVVFDRTAPGLAGAPQVTPAAAASGTLVRVSFTSDEDLGEDPVVTLGGITLEKGQQVGRTYTYAHVALAADGDGDRALGITLVDRAGNGSGTLAGPTVRFDFTPPAVQALTVCDDDGTAATCGAEQRTFSAQPGRNRVKLGFTLSEPPAEGGLTVTVAGTPLGTSGADACAPAGGNAWRCTATVVDAQGGAAPRIESATVAVTALDAAGNAGSTLTYLTYDFRPPALAGTPYFERCDGYGPARVAANDLHLEPVAAVTGAGCPLSPCGVSGPVRVELTVDEPVTLGAGGLSLDDGTPLALAACQSSSTQLVAVLQADPTPGTRTVRAAVRDGAGNASTLVLGTLRVDHVPPAAPDTSTVDRVVFHRYPWGADVTGGAKAFYLRGAAGAVAPGATVVAYDGADLATAAELGRTTADGAGAFGATPGAAGVFEIASGDVPEVFVAQEDAAGNRGPPALVWDAVWTATSGFKQAGQTAVNPNVFAEAPAWRDSRFSSAQREPVDPTAVATGAGAGISTYGEPELRRVAGTPDLPPKMGGCRMAYDPDLGRAVMFGGTWSVYAVGSFWGADTWEWDGDSWRLLDTPQQPPVRTEHGFAYDEARRRFVLFGGTSGATPVLLGDTWELDGTTWKRVCWPGCAVGQCTCTTMPSPRRGAATFYDPVLGKVIVAGGTDASGDRNDTWSWDGRTWTQLTPAAAPLTHSNANVAVSPERGEVMILRPAGGTFVWNGTTWASHAAADGGGSSVDLWWDPGDQRWHRYVPAGRLMFTWSGTSWDGPTTGFPTVGDFSGLATPLVNDCGAFDRERGGYLRFGGCISADCRSDTSAQQHTGFYTWQVLRQLAPGFHPAGRTGAALADVSSEGVVWLYGGRSSARYPFIDNWTWDGATWRTDGLSNDFYGTYDAAMTHAGGGVLLRFGGVPAGGGVYPGATTSNTWYRTAGWGWTQNAVAGTEPIPRANQSEQDDQALTWDEVNDRGVFFRGTSLGSATWTALYTAGTGITWAAYGGAAPASVRGHRMTYCPGVGGVVLFGGQNGSGTYLADTWTWSGSAWTQRTPVTSPPPRAGHAMVCDRNRGKLYVIGGRDAAGDRDDVWEWDGTTWRERFPSEKPSARSGAGAAWLSARGTGVIFGGAGNGYQDDTWIFDGGRDRTPAQVLHARFAAAGTGEATLREIGARFETGGTSYSALVALQGARLHLRDRGLWRQVASHTAAAAGPGTLTWSTAVDAEWTAPGAAARMRRLLAGDSLDLSFAVTPLGTNRAVSSGARLSTRYAEVAVRYRLACLAAGSATLHAPRCCSGVTTGSVCQ